MGTTPAQLDEALDRSQQPARRSSLYETFAGLGVGEGHVILDIGARADRHSLRLAEQFGCRVLAVEPVEDNVAKAQAAVADHD